MDTFHLYLIDVLEIIYQDFVLSPGKLYLGTINVAIPEANFIEHVWGPITDIKRGRII